MSKEQIEALKAKHGEIFEATVEDKKCWLKKPDRKTLAYASTFAKTNPLKFNEVILENCWLGGDEEIKTQDEYFLAVCGVLEGLMAVKQAELKKC